MLLQIAICLVFEISLKQWGWLLSGVLILVLSWFMMNRISTV
jgi:hypothetical protein